MQISLSASPISKHVTLTQNLDKVTFKLLDLSYGKTDVLEDFIKQVNDSYRTRRTLDYNNTKTYQGHMTPYRGYYVHYKCLAG